MPTEIDMASSACTLDTAETSSGNMAHTLAEELSQVVKGGVRYAADRATEGAAVADSGRREVPSVVVTPRDADDVVAALSVCRKYTIAVLPAGAANVTPAWGGGTAVTIDFAAHMNRIVEFKPRLHRIRVQPACALADLGAAVKNDRLTFAPASFMHAHDTFGDIVGNDARAAPAILAGHAMEQVQSLDVVTVDGLRMQVGATSECELQQIINAGGRRGEIYAGLRWIRDHYADLIRLRYPHIPRRVSGYNLDALLPENGFNVARALAGSEGTCVAVLEAELRLVDRAPARALLALGYESIVDAANDVSRIMEFHPTALEGVGAVLVGDHNLSSAGPDERGPLPNGNAWLLVGFDADDALQADALARALMRELDQDRNLTGMKLIQNAGEMATLQAIRQAGLCLGSQAGGGRAACTRWHHAAVAPGRLGGYLRDFRNLLGRFGYRCALYGPFAEGCIRCSITGARLTPIAEKHWRQFMAEDADLVLRYGGSLATQHADLSLKAESLQQMFGPELVEAFGQFKGLWDPDNRMNPCGVVASLTVPAELSDARNYQPPRLPTRFDWPSSRSGHASPARRVNGRVGADLFAGSSGI